MDARAVDDETEVRLEATVTRARLPDRLLLALGGRWWLRRRFRATLTRLIEHFRCARSVRPRRLLSQTC
jgi:hypothetical protein